MAATIDADARRYQVCFRSLAAGRTLRFPCDARGTVDMDHLPKHSLLEYLYARAMVGRDFSAPCVEPWGAATGGR